MSLSSSMWAGVTGLLSHGEKMNVIGNNLANVSTVGFKSQRMDFQDFVYQNTYTNSGISQVGRGVKVGAILGDFSQGTFENTQEVTDLAITGRGFFKVKPEGSNQEYYTRAGNFRFDKAGNLKDPNGYMLQGWKVDTSNAAQRAAGGTAPSTNTTKVQGTGTPTDVKLDTWTISPLQTTQVSFNMNLSKEGVDNSRYSGHPFTSLLENWNGTQPPLPNTSPLSASQYSGTPASITVYDESGGAHTLSIYFDKVSQDDYADSNKSEQMWEYVVTMDPAEDVRQVAEPKNAGWYEAAALKGTGKSYTVKEGFQAPVTVTAADGTTTIELKTFAEGYVLSPAEITSLVDYTSQGVDYVNVDGANPATPGTFTGGGFNIKDITETKMAGVLMTGTLTFDSAGGLKNQSAYVVNGTRIPLNIGGNNADAVYAEGNGYAIDVEGNPIPVMNENNPAAYMYATDVSKNGYPLMVANFTGIPGAHSVGSVPDADKYLIELDFGIKASNLDQPWQSDLPLSVTNTPTTKEAAVKAYTGYLAGTPPSYNDPDVTLWMTDGVAENYTSVVKNPTDGAMPEYLYVNPSYSASKYLSTYKKYLEKENEITELKDFAALYPDDGTATLTPAEQARLDDYKVRYSHLIEINPGDPSANPVVPPSDNTGANITAAITAATAELPALKVEVAKNGKYFGAALDNGISATKVALDPTAPPPADGSDPAGLWNISAVTSRAWTTSSSDPLGRLLVGAEPSLSSDLANYTEPVIRTSGAFTSTSRGGTAENAVIGASQNGYGYGDLTSWSVDSDGILSGVYSNGVTLPLYQIALYDFTNKQGLRREGGNLFSQTMASGDPSSAAAGTSGFGTINAQSLEGSNVDMSTEFVYMIATQRGFQSNSKMITTVDTMLDTVINMKR